MNTNKIERKNLYNSYKPSVLHKTECSTTVKQHVHKMSATKMRMLNWMCGKIRKDRIRHEYIHEMIRVAPIVNKLRENMLK